MVKTYVGRTVIGKYNSRGYSVVVGGIELFGEKKIMNISKAKSLCIKKVKQVCKERKLTERYVFFDPITIK